VIEAPGGSQLNGLLDRIEGVSWGPVLLRIAQVRASGTWIAWRVVVHRQGRQGAAEGLGSVAEEATYAGSSAVAVATTDRAIHRTAEIGVCLFIMPLFSCS